MKIVSYKNVIMVLAKKKYRKSSDKTDILHEKLFSFRKNANKYMTAKQIELYKQHELYLLKFMDQPEIYDEIKGISDCSLFSSMLILIFNEIGINRLVYNKIMTDFELSKNYFKIERIRRCKYFGVLKKAF